MDTLASCYLLLLLSIDLLEFIRLRTTRIYSTEKGTFIFYSKADGAFFVQKYFGNFLMMLFYLIKIFLTSDTQNANLSDSIGNPFDF